MAASEGIQCEELVAIINEEMCKVKDQVRALKAQGDQVSIGDMFELQMRMNHLSQISEAGTQFVSATHQALISMARNLK